MEVWHDWMYEDMTRCWDCEALGRICDSCKEGYWVCWDCIGLGYECRKCTQRKKTKEADNADEAIKNKTKK